MYVPLHDHVVLPAAEARADGGGHHIDGGLHVVLCDFGAAAEVQVYRCACGSQVPRRERQRMINLRVIN